MTWSFTFVTYSNLIAKFIASVQTHYAYLASASIYEARVSPCIRLSILLTSISMKYEYTQGMIATCSLNMELFNRISSKPATLLRLDIRCCINFSWSKTAYQIYD
jgi:hypothetical protein